MRRTWWVLLTLSACTPPGFQSDGTLFGNKGKPGPKAVQPAAGLGISGQPVIGGVAHIGLIDRVRLSPDGRSALSRDSFGGLRLWETIDGRSQPVAIPVRDVLDMSLARASDGWTLAVIDGAGALHVLAVDGRTKRSRATWSSSPHEAITQAIVMPGGTHVAVLGADRSVRLRHRNGRLASRWQPRGFPTRSIRLAGTTLLAVADDGQVEMGAVDARAYLLRADAAKLRAVHGPIELESTANLGAAATALSADAELVAWASLVPPKLKGRWVSKLSVRALNSSRARSIPTKLGRRVITSIGFVAPRRLAITTSDSVTWLVDLRDPRPEPRPVISHAQMAVPVPAYGPMMRLSARADWLMVHDLRTQKTKYLGYKAFRPGSGTFSPSGKWLAWTHGRSVMIESTRAADNRTFDVPHPKDSFTGPPIFVRFVDDDHLIELNRKGRLRVVRWRTGTTIDQLTTIRTFRAEYDPKTRVVKLWRGSKVREAYRVSTRDGLDEVEPITPPRRFGVSAVTLRGNSTARFVRLALPGRPVQRFPIENTALIRASPKSDQLVAMDFRGNIAGYALSPFQKRWGLIYHQRVRPSIVEWSGDQRVIALAGSHGAMLVRASDGRVLKKRCSVRFEVRTNVPRRRSGLANICQ